MKGYRIKGSEDAGGTYPSQPGGPSQGGAGGYLIYIYMYLRMDRSRLRMDRSEYLILPARCHQRRKMNFAGPKQGTSNRMRPYFGLVDSG